MPMLEGTVTYILREGARGYETLFGVRASSFQHGKLMAPGGKCNPGEHHRDCGWREPEEEVGVFIPRNRLRHFGTITYYDFRDGQHVAGFKVHQYIVGVNGWSGEPQAIPGKGFSSVEWHPLDQIPFHRMVVDQREWLSRALAIPRSQIFVADVYYRDDKQTQFQRMEARIVRKGRTKTRALVT